MRPAGEKERLSLRRERRFARVQHDLADPLAGGRASGLARLYDGASALRECFGQTRGLKRLAQTLAALERKEDACHLKIWTRRKGSCPLLRELRFARSTSSC